MFKNVIVNSYVIAYLLKTYEKCGQWWFKGEDCKLKSHIKRMSHIKRKSPTSRECPQKKEKIYL